MNTLDKISTGIESLDYILHGGLPLGSTILLVGNPGTGKTILANQIIYKNASPDNKVLYFTTMSEPQIKVMKFQQEFSFFDIDKFQQNILYYDMGGILIKYGTKTLLTYIDELLVKHQPKLLVIDTIRTIAEMIPSKPEFREFILNLSLKLTVWGCTTLLLGEYSENEIQERPESSIVDGIIFLSGIEERKYQKRFLRILKMRGTDYESGETYFKITDDGIKMFPKLNRESSETYHSNNYSERVSTGSLRIDYMLGGGIPKSTVTMISGGTGTGKTLIAATFAYEGLKQGESVVYATFEENTEQFLNSTLSVGMVFQPYIDLGKFMLIHVSPVELDMDEHIYMIQEYIRKMKADRLVIDSISSFELGVLDKIKYTDYIWSLTNYLKNKGITCILTHEIHHSMQLTEMTKHGISFAADNFILLQSREEENQVKRYMRIVKSRSNSHDMNLNEYRISGNGISFVDCAE